MLLLANQPEGLIAIAIIAVVAGTAIPVFGRLGFGSAVSVAGQSVAGGPPNQALRPTPPHWFFPSGSSRSTRCV